MYLHVSRLLALVLAATLLLCALPAVAEAPLFTQEMIERSYVAPGDTTRLHRAIDKAKNGEEVSIFIPESVTSIDSRAFSGLSNFTLLVKEGDKKPIIINITDESMELKINSIVGSMNEDIDIEKSGKDLMIGFNPKFLIDALRVIDDEEVDLYMVNPKAPCFIKNAEESYIYLILPVNFTTVS